MNIRTTFFKRQTLTGRVGILLLMILLTSVQSIKANKDEKRVDNRDYSFDGNISEEVLRNYLDRSITMAGACSSPNINGGKEVSSSRADDIRLIENIGAKFVGRALFRWGGEDKLNSEEFIPYAKEFIEEVHRFDSDVVFQAAIFEAITTKVDSVTIPSHVFAAFDLADDSRNFNYGSMLFPSGRYVDFWREGSSVPDITQLETQMWFYYLATLYIDAGFEGIHWGQISVIGASDKDLSYWQGMIQRIRDYAKVNARRHFVLHDAHAPEGGVLKDGQLLMDFNSFPLRPVEIVEEPMRVELPKGRHYDSIYNRSLGGVTPSGWSCSSLPYIVEIDNYGGLSDTPGVPDREGVCVWGYDEITWFSLQSVEDQKSSLEQLYREVKEIDSSAYMQMPVCRVAFTKEGKSYMYKANIKSDACPSGTGLEEKIKKIWSR